jgi:hypothetical protein
MPERTRGKHAFRPSQQSRGAASNMPASLSKGKGRGKAKAKGTEPEQGQGVEIGLGLQVDNNGENDSDRPAITFPPSPVPSSTIFSLSPVPPSTIPSTSTSTSDSKRKYSALDDDELSSSCNISGKKCSGTVAMGDVSTSIDGVGGSIGELVAENKLFCKAYETNHTQHEARVEKRLDTQIAQAAEAASTSPEKRRANAVDRLQEREVYLTPEAMVVLMQHVAQDTAAADLYLSMKRDKYSKAWVKMRLEKLKFTGKVTDNDG